MCALIQALLTDELRSLFLSLETDPLVSSAGVSATAAGQRSNYDIMNSFAQYSGDGKKEGSEAKGSGDVVDARRKFPALSLSRAAVFIVRFLHILHCNNLLSINSNFFLSCHFSDCESACGLDVRSFPCVSLSEQSARGS